jgi:hypothetical protein
MMQGVKLTTRIFLGVLALTIALWVLRGIGLLGFMPGLVLWSLIFACLLLAVLSSIR